MSEQPQQPTLGLQSTERSQFADEFTNLAARRLSELQAKNISANKPQIGAWQQHTAGSIQVRVPRGKSQRMLTLWFVPRGSLPGIYVDFELDDTALSTFVQREFPNGLIVQEPQKVNILVKWRTVNGQAIASEISPASPFSKPPEEKTMLPDTPAAVDPMSESVSPDGPVKLADIFPHDELECAPWVNNDKMRGEFFKNWKALADKLGVPEKEREPIRHATLSRLTGEPTLKKYKGTVTDLMEALETDLEWWKEKQRETAAQNVAMDEKVSDNPATVQNAPSAKSDGKTSIPGNDEPAPDKSKKLVPAACLFEIKTLTGIPIGQIRSYLNKKHPDGSYHNIDAKDGSDHWTDLDPVAVRRRFDKVFGPQGFGWRIVPIPGLGHITCETKIETTKAGKERTLYLVAMEGFVFEYAVIGLDGKISYVQTSALSDTDKNDDKGYAYRGVMTSMQKQALRLFGGFDHFMALEFTDVPAAHEQIVA